MAEEREALRPWARKGGDKKRKTGGVRREEELFFSSVIFDGCRRKKFIPFRLSLVLSGLGIATAFGQPCELAFSNEFSDMDGRPVPMILTPR